MRVAIPPYRSGQFRRYWHLQDVATAETPEVAIPPYRSGQFRLNDSFERMYQQIRRRNPTVQIRAVPTNTGPVLRERTAFEGLSQSHRTDQGSSDFIHLEATAAFKGKKSRNPTVQIRAVPTWFFDGPPFELKADTRSRNPTVQIRAVPTRFWACCASGWTKKSQSHRTDQGSSDCGLPTSLILLHLSWPFL